MKLVFLLLFALFPYLHNQRYTVQYDSCERERIVVKDNGDPFEITLFNLSVDEQGWERTCSIMKKAKTLEIEIDASTQISEPLAVYLFADGELVQKTLVRENHAYTLIHNPEYRYEKELQALEESKATMAIVDPASDTGKTQSNGWLFLLFIFCSWMFMIVYGVLYLRRCILDAKGHPSKKES